MHRTESTPLAKLVLALFVGFLLAASPAVSEEMQIYEGEPTDPEGSLVLFEMSDEELANHGLSTPPAEDDAGFASWYQALLEVLRSLGLLPEEGRTQ